MAGLLKHDAGHVHTGNVTYNGRTKDSKEFSLPKLVHFVEQVREANVSPAWKKRREEKYV